VFPQLVAEALEINRKRGGVAECADVLNRTEIEYLCKGSDCVEKRQFLYPAASRIREQIEVDLHRSIGDRGGQLGKAPSSARQSINCRGFDERGYIGAGLDIPQTVAQCLRACRREYGFDKFVEFRPQPGIVERNEARAEGLVGIA
jgi:hypothetical protein